MTKRAQLHDKGFPRPYLGKIYEMTKTKHAYNLPNKGKEEQNRGGAYCRFHRTKSHHTDNCHLKNNIERLIQKGHLGNFQKANNENGTGNYTPDLNENQAGNRSNLIAPIHGGSHFVGACKKAQEKYMQEAKIQQREVFHFKQAQKSLHNS